MSLVPAAVHSVRSDSEASRPGAEVIRPRGSATSHCDHLTWAKHSISKATYDDISYIHGINIDLSYKHPLNEKSKMELGYDGKINDNTEIMNFQITDASNIFKGENTFGYKRSIHGLFLEYDYKLNDKFSIKPSIRYEFVSKDISFKSIKSDANPSILYSEILSQLDDSTYIDNYSTLYPDLHFTYNVTEKQSLQFGLSKRVNRPGDGGHGGGSRQIRPFPRDVYSENFIFMGNPFLKPEYSTQYELSFKSP